MLDVILPKYIRHNGHMKPQNTYSKHGE